jgi:hypothetical protein
MIGLLVPTRAGRRWVPVASAAFLIVALIIAWLMATPGFLVREQLKTFQFWSLEACVALGVLLGVGVLKEIGRDLDRRGLLQISAVALLSVVLTVFVAPRTNRIFYDEQIYQSIGQNLTDLKLAQMCNDGNVEYGRLQCSNGEYNKQPYAYPHLLSVAGRLFGVREANAFAVNALVMAATVCAMYLLAVALFDDRLAAFFAALLIALTPEQLVWSATASVEPSASLALVVALLCAAQFCRSRSDRSLAAAAVAAAYAVQFRQESLLIVPIIGVLLWARASDEFSRPRFWWAGMLFLVLVAVHIGHTFVVRNEPWGTTQARLSLAYLPANVLVNGPFYLWDERFPFVFTLLALVGLASRRLRPERAVLVAYFLLFLGTGLLFYAGSYNYGADVRYSLLTYPPLAALGGLGAARIVGRIARWRPHLPALSLVAAVLAFQFLWYLPIVRATTEEAWAARADVRFAKSIVPALRGNSYVLTHNPGMFHVWGVNAGQMSLIVTSPAYLEYLARRYSGGVYLHWNFWCNVHDDVQRAFCRNALAVGPVELVWEARERDQRFAFYRFKPADP